MYNDTLYSKRRAWKQLGTEVGRPCLGGMLRKGLAKEEAFRLTPEGRGVARTHREWMMLGSESRGRVDDAGQREPRKSSVGGAAMAAGRPQKAKLEREVGAGSDPAAACEPVEGVWASFSVQQEAVGGF